MHHAVAPVLPLKMLRAQGYGMLPWECAAHPIPDHFRMGMGCEPLDNCMIFGMVCDLQEQQCDEAFVVALQAAMKAVLNSTTSSCR